MTNNKRAPRLKLDLLGKFAILSFFTLAAMGLVMGWKIQRYVEKMALENEAEHEASWAHSFLAKNLLATDFTKTPDPQRYEEMDRLIRENLQGSHVVRIKIWNTDGQIIYSDKKELLGRRFPVEGELKEALGGNVAIELSKLKRAENVYERGVYKRLMEIYVPLRLQGSSKIEGVFEIYHDMANFEPDLASMRRFIWSWLGLGLLVLFGSLFWIVRNASRELIRRNDENVRLYQEVKEQLVERKRAEESLQKSEDLYRDLVEHSQELICTHDLNGRILSINQWAANLLGYETLLGMNVRDILCPEVQHQFDAYLDTIHKEGVARGLMLVQTAKGENRIWQYTNTLRKGGVTVPIVRGMAHDITERKLAEEEVQRNYDTQTTINSILRLSLENIPLEEILKRTLTLILSIPWLVFESRGCIFLVEDTPEVLVMKAQNKLAKPIQMSCGQVPFGKCLCGRAASTGEIHFADHIDNAHEILYEGIIPHGHYCVPIMFGGRTLGVLNIYVKEGHPRNRKEEGFLLAVANTLAGIIIRNQVEKEMTALQDQLRQSQKMEAIGQLAGGIAHDFNNLLTVIGGYSEFSLRELQGNSSIRENLEEISKASQKASALTRQLLAFSRRQVLEVEVLELNTILRDMDKMLRRLIGEDIELKTVFDENPGRVMTDRGQIEQVILNLAVNAKDAMPSGGKLTIETANVELDEEYTQTQVGLNPGSYVLLSIVDSGVGIRPEVKEHIFEPFFTTKEKGKGTGLGLSTVYGIVKQSGGNISVYSELGVGTTFNVYLPRVEKPLEVGAEKPVNIESLYGEETILVVEDEQEVRELAVRILKNHGYRIIEASQGGEAISICEDRKGPVHLMITDVIMPGMSGRELAKHLTPIFPKMKVLYSSGYTDEAIVHHGVLEKGTHYIQKPFTLDGLARKVREVLDN